MVHPPPWPILPVVEANYSPVKKLGDLVVEQNLQSIEGCHGSSPRTPLANYYRPQVSIPPSNRDKCTDDMATVQFGPALQFTFIFHPSRFHVNALQFAHHQLGIVDNMVDAMVWMGDDEKELRNLTTNSRIDLGPLLPLLITSQNTSLGRYFGADNPWITNPPDNHPCMPGIPDDEAKILLWLLLLLLQE